MAINMKVERNGETIELSGKAGTPTYNERKIVSVGSPSEEAMALREAWLRK
jgi:hypothetical protein